MENATKALLIAAAVLIAVIIITITLGVVRQGQDAVQNVDMSEVEMAAHNSKFTNYEGTSVSAAQVNQLLNAVEVNNALSEYTVTCTEITTEPGARYTVECGYEKGIVNQITITKND